MPSTRFALIVVLRSRRIQRRSRRRHPGSRPPKDQERKKATNVSLHDLPDGRGCSRSDSHRFDDVWKMVARRRRRRRRCGQQQRWRQEFLDVSRHQRWRLIPAVYEDFFPETPSSVCACAWGKGSAARSLSLFLFLLLFSLWSGLGSMLPLLLLLLLLLTVFPCLHRSLSLTPSQLRKRPAFPDKIHTDVFPVRFGCPCAGAPNCKRFPWWGFLPGPRRASSTSTKW